MCNTRRPNTKKKLQSGDYSCTSSEQLLIRSDMKEISLKIDCFYWGENVSWITSVQIETLSSMSLSSIQQFIQKHYRYVNLETIRPLQLSCDAY